VYASIILAPSSTKNSEGERDPEMHQTKKGNQWHFGMKAHIGVDADSGLVHTVTTTAANDSDVEQVADLLHGKEHGTSADAVRAFESVDDAPAVDGDDGRSPSENGVRAQKGAQKPLPEAIAS
jgi:IS5 family transposase